MWHYVDLVWTDICEDRIASIFRVEKIHDQGTTTQDLHSATSQKTAFFIVISVETSYLMNLLLFGSFCLKFVNIPDFCEGRSVVQFYGHVL
jgi:hypothetical protein